MARPQKSNLDYFSHDNNMRNDPKIKAVRTKFGLVGFAVYVMLIEAIAEADLLQIEFDEVNAEILAGDFGIDSDQLTELIHYFCRVKLITIEENVIRCPALDRRSKPVFDKRKEDLHGLRNENNGFNIVSASETPGNEAQDTFPDSNREKNTQSKAKQSKVKKSKQQETAGNPGGDDAFLSQSDGAAIAALKNAGIEPVQAAALVTQFGAQRCLNEVDKCKFGIEKGRVNDPPGWIIASLQSENGYTVSGWKSPEQRAAERAASAAEKQRQIETEQEKVRRATAEHERQKALDALFASKPPEEQRRIAAEIVASYQQQGQFQRDMIKRLKSGGKSDLQAIKASPILQSVRNEYLSTAEQAAQC